MSSPKSAVGSLLLFVLIASGFFGIILNFVLVLTEFTLWLFTLSLTEFGLSPTIEIGIKIGTFLFSFTIVGYLFGLLRWFNSDVMSFAYFLVSTLVGFVLSYFLMLLQTHIITIGWMFLITILLLLSIVLLKKHGFLLGSGVKHAE
jgi:hypothetical protein